jgi:hypothetical protein
MSMSVSGINVTWSLNLKKWLGSQRSALLLRLVVMITQGGRSRVNRYRPRRIEAYHFQRSHSLERITSALHTDNDHGTIREYRVA